MLLEEEAEVGEADANQHLVCEYNIRQSAVSQVVAYGLL